MTKLIKFSTIARPIDRVFNQCAGGRIPWPPPQTDSAENQGVSFDGRVVRAVDNRGEVTNNEVTVDYRKACRTGD